MNNSDIQSLKNPIYPTFALYEQMPLKEYDRVIWRQLSNGIDLLVKFSISILHGVQRMTNNQLLEELNTLVTCQQVIAELLGAIPEGRCSTKSLAVLLDYLQTQQEKLLVAVTRQQVRPEIRAFYI